MAKIHPAQQETAREPAEHKDREAISVQLPHLTALRSAGMSAGDLRIAVLSEVDQLLEDNRDNPVKACKAGLFRLQASGHISPQEVTQLGKICTLIFQRQRNKLRDAGADGRTGEREVWRIYALA